jgi:hypothetical protein
MDEDVLEQLLEGKGIRIGTIGNYYGGLSVALLEGKAYWGIENYNGCYWEEIPMSLYNELIKFQQGE